MIPLVSVVIAVYNSGKFLEQSIGTILVQSLVNFELILVDDGSTDDSLLLLEEFQRKDSRIKLISQENQGAGVARNTGMTVAQGKYILFLDSDDYFEPDMLEIMLAKAEETGADVTICRATCFDHETGQELPSDWLRKDKFLDRFKGRAVFSPAEMKDCLFQFTYGWAWDKLFRLDFVKGKKFEFSHSENSNDLLFVYQSLVTARKIAFLCDKLVHYRMKRSSSISGDAQEWHQAERSLHEMCLLETYLHQYELFSVFQQTFLNFSMEFRLWQVSHISVNSVQKEAFFKLKKGLQTEDVYKLHPIQYFHDKKTYLKYLLVKYFDFSVYYLMFSLYQKGK
ncbi:MAG: glycosyltransferase [Eubacteriales bacterium]